MPSMETRSQRRQAYAQRPPYPQVATQSSSTSTASSAFQSSTSVNSISTSNTPFPGTLAMPQQGFTSAPLPSPSTGNQQRSYFAPTGSQVSSSHPQQQTQQHRIPLQQQQSFLGQRGAGGGAPETAPFLDNFNLVAEAAKRAQMECLMRDLGEVEL